MEDSVGFLDWGGVRLLGVVLRQPEETFSTASVADVRLLITLRLPLKADISQ
jgi:hypothetical protein